MIDSHNTVRGKHPNVEQLDSELIMKLCAIGVELVSFYHIVKFGDGTGKSFAAALLQLCKELILLSDKETCTDSKILLRKMPKGSVSVNDGTNNPNAVNIAYNNVETDGTDTLREFRKIDPFIHRQMQNKIDPPPGNNPQHVPTFRLNHDVLYKYCQVNLLIAECSSSPVDLYDIGKVDMGMGKTLGGIAETYGFVCTGIQLYFLHYIRDDINGVIWREEDVDSFTKFPVVEVRRKKDRKGEGYTEGLRNVLNKLIRMVKKAEADRDEIVSGLENTQIESQSLENVESSHTIPKNTNYVYIGNSANKAKAVGVGQQFYHEVYAPGEYRAKHKCTIKEAWVHGFKLSRGYVEPDNDDDDDEAIASTSK